MQTQKTRRRIWLPWNDFIATFPDSPDGYLNRANHYAYHRVIWLYEAEQGGAYLDKALKI